MKRNYAEIVEILVNEFEGKQPYPNPYIFSIQLPKGMGIRHLIEYLEPAQGIEIENHAHGLIYVNVDEFDAVVVDNTTPLSDYFNVKPFDPHYCIKVQSLEGELATQQVHAVQNVNAKLFSIGEHVRVAILYSNGTDYGARRVIG